MLWEGPALAYISYIGHPYAAAVLVHIFNLKPEHMRRFTAARLTPSSKGAWYKYDVLKLLVGNTKIQSGSVIISNTAYRGCTARSRHFPQIEASMRICGCPPHIVTACGVYTILNTVTPYIQRPSRAGVLQASARQERARGRSGSTACPAAESPSYMAACLTAARASATHRCCGERQHE